MFVSDRFVFVELHKTGTTHIRQLLRDVVGGELVGKHNRITQGLLNGSRVVLGSIRNPWDWYVSLWAFGCDGNGDLFATATKRRRLRGHGWRSDPLAAIGRAAQELRRDPDEWRRCYADSDDPDAFRRWLSLVLYHLPYQAYDYGTPSLGRHVGLMGYRYLHLFCATEESGPALARLDSFEAVAMHEREHNLVDHFVRNETLEDTFIDALQQSGYELTAADIQRIRGQQRVNTSSRRRETSYFYDAPTAAMVADRERMLIERFGYVSPLAPVITEAPALEPALSAVEGALAPAEAPAAAESA